MLHLESQSMSMIFILSRLCNARRLTAYESKSYDTRIDTNLFHCILLGKRIV